MGANPTEECIWDLDEQKKYLGAPQVAWYLNYEKFSPLEYGENSIIRESKVFTKLFSPKKPSYVEFSSEEVELNDETSLLQLGSATVRRIYDWTLNEVQTSAWNKFPTKEEPSLTYKFMSVHLIHGTDLEEINR